MESWQISQELKVVYNSHYFIFTVLSPILTGNEKMPATSKYYNLILVVLFLIITTSSIYIIYKLNFNHTQKDIILKTGSSAVKIIQAVKEANDSIPIKAFVLNKMVFTDMNDNVTYARDLKQVYLRIDTQNKTIKINHPENYFEVYYYNRIDKNLNANGSYYDIYGIYRSYTSKGNSNLTDALILVKDPASNRLISIKMYFKDKGVLTFFVKQ